MSAIPGYGTEVYHDGHIIAYLSHTPTTNGHTGIVLRPDVRRDPSSSHALFSSERDFFVRALLKVQTVARKVQEHYRVQRCALVTTGVTWLSILPLHGLTGDWKPITNGAEEYNKWYPGYISSKNGPHMDSGTLDDIQLKIRLHSKTKQPVSYHFDGDDADQNLFARIIRGEIQQWRIWEDEHHVAFLTPFANTPGFTVLVPRKHLSSDIFSLDEGDYRKLMEAAHTVGNSLKRAFDAPQCGMIFEGFEIDYAHVKLIPVVLPPPEVEVNYSGLEAPYEETYQGFVTSLNGPPIHNPTTLANDAAALRQSLS